MSLIVAAAGILYSAPSPVAANVVTSPLDEWVIEFEVTHHGRGEHYEELLYGSYSHTELSTDGMTWLGSYSSSQSNICADPAQVGEGSGGGVGSLAVTSGGFFPANFGLDPGTSWTGLTPVPSGSFTIHYTIPPSICGPGNTFSVDGQAPPIGPVFLPGSIEDLALLPAGTTFCSGVLSAPTGECPASDPGYTYAPVSQDSFYLNVKYTAHKALAATTAVLQLSVESDTPGVFSVAGVIDGDVGSVGDGTGLSETLSAAVPAQTPLELTVTDDQFGLGATSVTCFGAAAELTEVTESQATITIEPLIAGSLAPCTVHYTQIERCQYESRGWVFAQGDDLFRFDANVRWCTNGESVTISEAEADSGSVLAPSAAVIWEQLGVTWRVGEESEPTITGQQIKTVDFDGEFEVCFGLPTLVPGLGAAKLFGATLARLPLAARQRIVATAVATAMAVSPSLIKNLTDALVGLGFGAVTDGSCHEVWEPTVTVRILPSGEVQWYDPLPVDEPFTLERVL